MSVASSWIHGNALTMESPFHFNPHGEQNGRLILTPFGWGAEVTNEGHAVVSWMHVPIPSTDIRDGLFARFELRRVFLLFQCEDATISDVHVYDGHKEIQEFGGLALTGTFLTRGPQNTFQLARARSVTSGVGLSFLFKGYSGGPAPIPHARLLVAAAGAEFDKGTIFLNAIGDIASRLFRGP